MSVELLEVLFPHLAGIRVDRVAATGTVRFDAATCTPTATCPQCGLASARVHSRYLRRLADHGLGSREVTIRLQVRRFFCATAGCQRRIFAEQATRLTRRYQRRSPALTTTLAQVGLALGGRAALHDDPDRSNGPAGAAVPVPNAVLEGLRGATTRQRHHEIHALADQGVDPTSIRRRLHLDPKTVRRYLRAASPEQLLAPDSTAARWCLRPGSAGRQVEHGQHHAGYQEHDQG